MTDLSCAIEECSVDLLGIRFLSPVVDKGRIASKPREERFPFRGSFQPMNQRELLLLPEGMRDQGRAKLYTTTRLHTVETSDFDLPDRVQYNGVTYKVERVDDWHELGGYYRVELVRMDR